MEDIVESTQVGRLEARPSLSEHTAVSYTDSLTFLFLVMLFLLYIICLFCILIIILFSILVLFLDLYCTWLKQYKTLSDPLGRKHSDSVLFSMVLGCIFYELYNFRIAHIVWSSVVHSIKAGMPNGLNIPCRVQNLHCMNLQYKSKKMWKYILLKDNRSKLEA